MSEDDQADAVPPQGSMRFQDDSTVPREPTLGERKAREQAARRERDDRLARAEADRTGASRRRRLLIGAGATVGVVAVIAVGYGLSRADDNVSAHCVGDDGVVVDDANCVTPAGNSGYYSGGGLYPIFFGGGGRQYHYYYGGSGSVGQVASGGTATVPHSSTHVTTESGRTLSGGSAAGGSVSSSGGSSSVSRGGLGSSSSSGRSGGSSSGS